MMATVIWVIFRLIFTWIAVNMADKRNRSTLGWGLFAFFISPLIAWIVLAILGNNTENN